MSRRHPPESRTPRESLPLFDPVSPASERGHEAARAAANRATSIDAGWKRDALAAVKDHCLRFQEFLAEHVPIVMPEGADRRAMGSVMQDAVRAGYCEANGYAPAVSSNSSPKTKWKSLIYANHGGSHA